MPQNHLKPSKSYHVLSLNLRPPSSLWDFLFSLLTFLEWCPPSSFLTPRVPVLPRGVPVLCPFVLAIIAVVWSAGRSFDRNRKWDIFLCHHKGGGGALARYVKIMFLGCLGLVFQKGSKEREGHFFPLCRMIVCEAFVYHSLLLVFFCEVLVFEEIFILGGQQSCKAMRPTTSVRQVVGLSVPAANHWLKRGHVAANRCQLARLSFVLAVSPPEERRFWAEDG